MRKKLLRYYQLEKGGGWTAIKSNKKVYKQGDSVAAFSLLKERLRLSGDFRSPDATALFTGELKAAAQTAQKRFGSEQDGVVGPLTMRELNKPVQHRIEQMLVNMERMRWMPPHSKGKRLVANIPEFKL